MQKLENVAAERSVLSGLLNYGKDLHLEICDIINCGTFCKDIHQLLYSVLDSLFKEEDKPTIPTLMSKASQMGLELFKDSKQVDIVKALQVFPVTKEGAINQAKVIRKLQIARDASSKLKEVYDSLSKVTGEESIDEILSRVESPILEFTTNLSTGNDNNPTPIFSEIDSYLEYLADNPVQNVGLPTEWPLMNSALGGGLRPKSVSIIASRTGCGKSHIGRAVAVHNALNNIPSLLLDTELTHEKQIARTVASISKVDIRTIETGQFGQDLETRRRVIEASKKLKCVPLKYMSVAGKSFKEILSIIRRWVIKNVERGDDGQYKQSLLVYDYMKLMGGDISNDAKEYQVLGQNITMLQDLCVQYNMACLTFVQTNREGISVEDLSIIAGSDRLSHLASNVCVLKVKTPEEQNQDGIHNGNVKLISLKARDGSSLGPGDYINYERLGQYSIFREIGLRSQMNTEAFDEDDGDTDF